MPTRWFCVVILGFWLFSTGWMLHRDWLPWLLATDQAPPFVFELADEVVAQNALWTLYRDGKKMGSARTSLKYVENNTFEWVQVLKNLEYSVGVGVFKLNAILPVATTTMFVTPKGELLRFETTAELHFQLPGIKFEMKMTLSGTVTNGQVSGECVLRSELGELKQPYGPTAVKGTNVFSPLQPLFRIGGLRPGKSWKLNQINPIDDAFRTALEQIATRFAIQIPPLPSGTTELLAEVLPEIRKLEMKEGTKKCFVIEYRNDKLVARTWVDAEDGTVWRQEAFMGGDQLALERN